MQKPSSNTGDSTQESQNQEEAATTIQERHPSKTTLVSSKLFIRWEVARILRLMDQSGKNYYWLAENPDTNNPLRSWTRAKTSILEIVRIIP